jgi:hypothetical protein
MGANTPTGSDPAVGLINTAESASAVSLRLRNLLQKYPSQIPVSWTPRNPNCSNDYLDFLSNTKTYAIRLQGGLFDDKKPRVENLVSL